MRNRFKEFFLNLILAYISIVLIGISFSITFDFILLKADFVISSTSLICEQPLNNKCVTHYKVVTSDSLSMDFVPLGEEFHIGELAINNHVEKRRFSLHYKINGIDKNWQYSHDMLAKFVIGVMGLIIRYLLLKIGYIKGNRRVSASGGKDC